MQLEKPVSQEPIEETVSLDTLTAASVPGGPESGLPTLSNRPKRSRVPPKQWWVNEDLENEPVRKETPAKKGPSKVFDPAFVTTNSTSRLAKADVYVSHRGFIGAKLWL